MDHLSALPMEILEMIVGWVRQDGRFLSLLYLSMVSRRCRAACVPVLFRTAVIRFSKESFKQFDELSKSSVAGCVREVIYEASLLLDPVLHPLNMSENSNPFSGSQCLCHCGHRHRASRLVPSIHMFQMQEDKTLREKLQVAVAAQNALLNGYADYAALSKPLCLLRNLSSFTLDLREGHMSKGYVANWFQIHADRPLSVPPYWSVRRHLSAAMVALREARRSGVAIRRVRIQSEVQIPDLNEAAPRRRHSRDVDDESHETSLFVDAETHLTSVGEVSLDDFYSHAFAGTRELELSYHSKDAGVYDKLHDLNRIREAGYRSMVLAASSSLESLNLDLKLDFSASTRCRRGSQWWLPPPHGVLVDCMLNDVHLPRLKTLCLTRYRVALPTFVKFMLDHAKTLRSLHLGTVFFKKIEEGDAVIRERQVSMAEILSSFELIAEKTVLDNVIFEDGWAGIPSLGVASAVERMLTSKTPK